MRARYYEPGSGRFVSEDPALQGMNWYIYCDNEPISRADVTGKFWWFWAGMALIGALGTMGAYWAAQAAKGQKVTPGGLIAAAVTGAVMGVVAVALGGAVIALAGGAALTAAAAAEALVLAGVVALIGIVVSGFISGAIEKGIDGPASSAGLSGVLLAAMCYQMICSAELSAQDE